MTAAQEIVQNLDDTQVVAMANSIHNRIFSAVDYAEIENSAGKDDVGKSLMGLTDNQLDQPLDTATAVTLSRQFLVIMAADPEMSGIVEEVWAELKNDDNLFVGAVIAVGLVFNLTLFMVASDIEINVGNTKIHKKPVDTEAVKAIAEIISTVAGLAKPN